MAISLTDGYYGPLSVWKKNGRYQPRTPLQMKDACIEYCNRMNELCMRKCPRKDCFFDCQGNTDVCIEGCTDGKTKSTEKFKQASDQEGEQAGEQKPTIHGEFLIVLLPLILLLCIFLITR